MLFVRRERFKNQKFILGHFVALLALQSIPVIFAAFTIEIHQQTQKIEVFFCVVQSPSSDHFWNVSRFCYCNCALLTLLCRNAFDPHLYPNAVRRVTYL